MNRRSREELSANLESFIRCSNYRRIQKEISTFDRSVRLIHQSKSVQVSSFAHCSSCLTRSNFCCCLWLPRRKSRVAREDGSFTNVVVWWSWGARAWRNARPLYIKSPHDHILVTSPLLTLSNKENSSSSFSFLRRLRLARFLIYPLIYLCIFVIRVLFLSLANQGRNHLKLITHHEHEH